MPKLAHISDIHFGRTFDIEIWKNVRAQIENFKPDILVASGDFVDHPRPFHLLAVKSELQDVCQQCTSKPQLFVVPGNHDLRLWGNIRIRLWPKWLDRVLMPDWFDRIMFNETAAARKKIEQAFNIHLGLNEESRRLTWRRWFKRFNPGNSIRWNVRKQCDGRVQSCDHRSNDGPWPTQSEHCQVAVVCFDSNPPKGTRLGFATGEVGADQITKLGRGRRVGSCAKCATRSSGRSESAVLLRVAVLHHHPLPIALSASQKRKRQERTLEPFLVLRNSGDLLQRLQQYKFDLVLHGHKHKLQFARLELNADGVDPYSLIVLATGSSAKDDEDDNALRLISTEANGRLTVETIKQGEARDAENEYREDFADLKQRAFSRAREHTKRTCSSIHREVKVDSVGNLSNILRVRQLRLLRGAEPIDGLPIGLVVPSHGQRYYDLIEPEGDCIKQICWRDGAGKLHPLNNIPKNGESGCCWIELSEKLEPGPGRKLTFGVRYPTSNSIAMTTWELAERKLKRDYESIWRYVSYPADRLTMRLELPPELEDVRPSLRCRRHPKYPDFPLTFSPEIAAAQFEEESFILDADLSEEEQRKLRYEANDQAWRLDIDYPIPGYIYELCWKVPVAAADNSIAGPTTDYQTMLLELGRRVAQNRVSNSDRECCDLFNKFARALMNQFASNNPHEQQVAFLMVYDRSDLHLYPAVWTASPSSFKVPLGAGVAGAAFLQRRVVPWGEAWGKDSLIRPIPIPGFDAKYVLALPIFYRRDPQSGGHLVTEPGAVIGVVTLASNASGSGIERCRGEDTSPKKLRNETQLTAQAIVSTILEKLSARPPA